MEPKVRKWINMTRRARKVRKRKVSFWATVKVPKRVKVTFYARKKRKAKK